MEIEEAMGDGENGRSRSRERRPSIHRQRSHAPSRGDNGSEDVDLELELQRTMEKFRKPCYNRKSGKPPPACMSSCDLCEGIGYVGDSKLEEVGRKIINQQVPLEGFSYDEERMLFENISYFKRSFSGYLHDHRCLTKGPYVGLQPFAHLVLMTLPSPLFRMMGRLTFYPREMFESIIDFVRRYEEDHQNDPNAKEDLVSFFGMNGEFTQQFSLSTFHQREELRRRMVSADTKLHVSMLLKESGQRTFHDLMAWFKPMIGPHVGFKPEIFCKTYLNGKQFSVPQLMEAFESPGYPQRSDMEGCPAKVVFRKLGTKARQYLLGNTEEYRNRMSANANEEELRIAMMRAREETMHVQQQPLAPSAPVNESGSFYFQSTPGYKRRGSDMSGPALKCNRTYSPDAQYVSESSSPFEQNYQTTNGTPNGGDSTYNADSAYLEHQESSSSESYPSTRNTPCFSPFILDEKDRDSAANKEAHMMLNALYYSWSASAIFYDLEKRRHEFGTTLVNSALCSPKCELLILRLSPSTAITEIAGMGLPRPTHSLSVPRQPNSQGILPSDVLFFRLHQRENSNISDTLRCDKFIDIGSFADVLRSFRVPVLAVADIADREFETFAT